MWRMQLLPSGSLQTARQQHVPAVQRTDSHDMLLDVIGSILQHHLYTIDTPTTAAACRNYTLLLTQVAAVHRGSSA
jgi:hypothetical protein